MQIQFPNSGRKFLLALCTTFLMAACGGGSDATTSIGQLPANQPVAATGNTAEPAQDPPNDNGLRKPWEPKDVAVFLAFGQSNSVSTGTLSSDDLVATPLANVYVARSKANETYANTSITWSKYSTVGDYAAGDATTIGHGYPSWMPENGYTPSDNRATSAAYLAARWQRRKNTDAAWPDLYILHVAVNSQGIDCRAYYGNGTTPNGWCPDLSPTDTRSLYHLSRHLIRLAVKDLEAAGKRPRFIGVDWNQWEEDAVMAYEAGLDTDKVYGRNLLRVVNGLSEAAGVQLPAWFHRPLAISPCCPPTVIANQIGGLVQSDPDRFRLIDPSLTAPVSPQQTIPVGTITVTARAGGNRPQGPSQRLNGKYIVVSKYPFGAPSEFDPAKPRADTVVSPVIAGVSAASPTFTYQVPASASNYSYWYIMKTAADNEPLDIGAVVVKDTSGKTIGLDAGFSITGNTIAGYDASFKATDILKYPDGSHPFSSVIPNNRAELFGIVAGGDRPVPIFGDDGVHYTTATQKWMAEQIWNDIVNGGRYGVFRE